MDNKEKSLADTKPMSYPPLNSYRIRQSDKPPAPRHRVPPVPVHPVTPSRREKLERFARLTEELAVLRQELLKDLS